MQKDTEQDRIAALKALSIMDTGPEPAFDDITRLASYICDTPIAYISFIDDEKQWYKSAVNLTMSETTLEDALCVQTIHETELVHVPDLSKDPRFSENTFVKNDPKIRFYAGYPLSIGEGTTIGTLCVVDFTVKALNDAQKTALEALGRQVVSLLQLRKSLIEQEEDKLELEAAHERTVSILASIATPFITLDGAHTIIYANDHATSFLGRPFDPDREESIWDHAPHLKETRLHKAIHESMATTRPVQFEEYYPHSKHWFDIHVSPALGGTSLYLEDITSRKAAEEKIFHQASFDQLTGLPNRHLFTEKLNQAIRQAKRNGWQCGVLFLDLNKFKEVNDNFGHPAGDLLLKQVAKRLRKAVRQEDVVARFGGDEFIIVAPRLSGREGAERIAKAVVTSLEKPIPLKRSKVTVTTSIGIALYPENGEMQDELIKHSDIALYQAKNNSLPFAFYEMPDRI